VNNSSTTGTIFDLKKYAIHDGPGIRTTVFFKGCPLDCWWCHNPEARKLEPETMKVRTTRGSLDGSPVVIEETVGRVVTVSEMMTEIRKDAIFYEESGGGVTFSGGEPMMQLPFLRSLLEACRAEEYHTAVDTSGYAPWKDFEAIADLVDLFLYDLKIIDDDAHVRYTTVTNAGILDNVRHLATRAAVTVRVPLIPGITDTDANLNAIADFLTPLPQLRDVSLLPYNHLAHDKCRRFQLDDRVGDLKTQTDDDMRERASLFEARGFRVKIGG